MDAILAPFMFVIAWILYGCHTVLNLVLGSDPVEVTGSVPGDVSTFSYPDAPDIQYYMPGAAGWNWAIAIVLLTVVTRVLLMPLFVRQMRSSRAMQKIQPEVQKIQARYKGKTDAASKQKMNAEMMELYKKAGSNPMSGCWPVLLQMPVFFALYRVLLNIPSIAEGKRGAIGPINQTLALQFEHSNIFGAQFSETFAKADSLQVRIVAGVLIVAMVAVTFFTQHQLTMKNMPPAATDNPMANNTKWLMYAMPFVYLITGPQFPIGVLVYWFTTNVWTFGQQYYVIRRSPAPGSEAEAKMLARKKAHEEKHGVVETITQTIEEISPRGQRQQPVRKSRAKTSPTSTPGLVAPSQPRSTVEMPKQVVLSSSDDDSSMPAPSMGTRRRKKDESASDE